MLPCLRRSVRGCVEDTDAVYPRRVTVSSSVCLPNAKIVGRPGGAAEPKKCPAYLAGIDSAARAKADASTHGGRAGAWAGSVRAGSIAAAAPPDQKRSHLRGDRIFGLVGAHAR